MLEFAQSPWERLAVPVAQVLCRMENTDHLPKDTNGSWLGALKATVSDYGRTQEAAYPLFEQLYHWLQAVLPVLEMLVDGIQLTTSTYQTPSALPWVFQCNYVGVLLRHLPERLETQWREAILEEESLAQWELDQQQSIARSAYYQKCYNDAKVQESELRKQAASKAGDFSGQGSGSAKMSAETKQERERVAAAGGDVEAADDRSDRGPASKQAPSSKKKQTGSDDKVANKKEGGISSGSMWVLFIIFSALMPVWSIFVSQNAEESELRKQ